MTTVHPILRSASRALRASLLLGVLLVGAAFHFWHHLQDPDCGSGRGADAHVCVACAGLHSSTLVTATQPVIVPQRASWVGAIAAARSIPAFATPRPASPRAPPES